jgi:fermentation-respiration switch protein FrsA (DUF1100 family)
MAFWTRRRKNIAGLLLAPAVLYGLLRLFEHRMTYAPSRAHDAEPGELQHPFEDITLTTSDHVRLQAWFFPAHTNSPRGGLVFLVAHGNGGNISHRLGLAAALLRTGASVLLFDYRGYGRSDGVPGEQGTYRDAEAALTWLLECGFASSDVIAYGESLGGGVAAELAVRHPLAGLVLQSSFTSTPDLGKELFPWLPVHTLAYYRYETIKKLPKLKLPVLVLHSRVDNIIPFHHGKRNFAVANEPKLFVELEADHNDRVDQEPELVAGLGRFLELIESTRGTLSSPKP